MRLAGIESGLGTGFEITVFNFFLRDEIKLLLTHLESNIYIYILREREREETG